MPFFTTRVKLLIKILAGSRKARDEMLIQALEFIRRYSTVCCPKVLAKISKFGTK
jgi:hypothetical protein